MVFKIEIAFEKEDWQGRVASTIYLVVSNNLIISVVLPERNNSFQIDRQWLEDN